MLQLFPCFTVTDPLHINKKKKTDQNSSDDDTKMHKIERSVFYFTSTPVHRLVALYHYSVPASPRLSEAYLIQLPCKNC